MKPKITIIKSDITQVHADAIVNAAGVGFGTMIGSGVTGAIRMAAGPELLKECTELRIKKYPNGIPTGEAIFTKAYNLEKTNNVKIIIHTVGPRYYSGDINLLKNCYINSLRLAEENDCKTIAFPAISTGAFGCPIEKSAQIVKDVLENYPFKPEIIEEIILVLFKQEDFNIYKK